MGKAEVIAPLARRLTREVLWAPAGVVLLHWTAGALFGHEPYVDPVMHFSGGVAVAYASRHAVTVGIDVFGRLTPLAADLCAFGATSAAAVLWEIGEYASDQLIHTNVQLSLDNTMRDLILGVSGAAVFLLVRRFAR